MPVKKPQSRKDIAEPFLRMVATGSVREAYDGFVDKGFRHHNAYYPGDAESLRKGMEEAHGKFSQTSIEIQREIEEGSLVAMHSKVKHSPTGRDIAVVHIMRFKGQRIAEFWDVGMEAPKSSPNEHGLF
jgi:predicted SnoaL-like aldol condensation-catalyzing enzyme